MGLPTLYIRYIRFQVYEKRKLELRSLKRLQGNFGQWERASKETKIAL